MPIVTPRTDAALIDHLAKSNADRHAVAQRQTIMIKDGTRLKAGGLWNSTVHAMSPDYWWKMSELTGTSAADSAGSNTGAYDSPSDITLNEASIIAGSVDPCPLFTPNGAMQGTIGWSD